MTATSYRLSPFLALLSALWLPFAVTAQEPPDAATARAWVAAMKEAERGPFARIRWFCADGERLPPEPGACRDHGGGHQHGEWSERTEALRDSGYRIANILAELDAARFTGAEGDRETLAQLLLERFLILADDGWIYRAARFYRGALQAEDEQAGARRLLLALLDDPAWRAPERYLPLREAVRLLPAAAWPVAPASAIRQQATALAERDPGFHNLRVKLHVLPEAGDAERVRAYAEGAAAELQPGYRDLAAAIEAFYRSQAASPRLRRLAAEATAGDLRELLGQAATALEGGRAPAIRLAAAGLYAVRLRDFVEASQPQAAGDRLLALQASLAVDEEAFVSANTLAPELAGGERRRLLGWLDSLTAALYGSGLLSARQWRAAHATLDDTLNRTTLPAADYLERLEYLGRVPEWAQRNLELHFEPAVVKLGELEPLTQRFIPDRLRAGPLLFFSRALARLSEDAARLAGQEHRLFGQPVAGGLRALNPGLARGVLHLPREGQPQEIRADGIHLLPATLESLPPLAGILTQGEGNGLSHIQLLARNLGIPNVVVGEARLAELAGHGDQPVVLAVSPRGRVVLERDGPQWDGLFGSAPAGDRTIRIDAARLDLTRRAPLPLRELRAADAGRLCGPKAANLGELHHHYPERVAPGVVIPFGAFRALLEQPLEAGGPKVFDWMRASYLVIGGLSGEARAAAERRFLERLRGWIEREAELAPEFLLGLRAALEREFGPGEEYGVFVRSDTNVEDLPGFTGAGLNRTEPNVRGFDNLLAALRRVWASPFSERAYGWRQAHMERPELVFPAVLIQLSVAVEKSGVMITADLESGDRGWVSVAVSEGVGGAVAGQRAEELRIHLESGRGRLLSQVSQPYRHALDPAGGLRTLPAAGPETLLQGDEARQLLELARELPVRYPLRGERPGETPVADVEFGFLDGRLMLFQIRPFVENRRARKIGFLAELDAGLEQRAATPVALDLAITNGGDP